MKINQVIHPTMAEAKLTFESAFGTFLESGLAKIHERALKPKTVIIALGKTECHAKGLDVETICMMRLAANLNTIWRDHGENNEKSANLKVVRIIESFSRLGSTRCIIRALANIGVKMLCMLNICGAATQEEIRDAYRRIYTKILPEVAKLRCPQNCKSCAAPYDGKDILTMVLATL